MRSRLALIQLVSMILVLPDVGGCGGDDDNPSGSSSRVTGQIFVANGRDSILVFDDASTLDGDVAPDRIIAGGATTLQFPWGVAVDGREDEIYLTVDNSVLVFEDASSVDGNVAPDRLIGGVASTVDDPAGFWIDESARETEPVRPVLGEFVDAFEP